jgi:hypothetical protein
MSDPIICDVRLVGDRKGKDDQRLVTFEMHHNDVTLDLLNAPRGSSWRMTLQELNNDGNPE